MKPGSSLIISDYDMAKSETGKGTDFIVQMPEVIAKTEKPEAKVRYVSSGYDRYEYRRPARPVRAYRPVYRSFFGYGY